MKKNNISNILDAFVALDNLSDEDLFESLSLEEAKAFDIRSQQEMEKAEDYLNNKQEEITLEVIDPDADSIEHIKKAEEYLGQCILQCRKCAATTFIDTDKLEVSENDPQIYNPELECVHCHAYGSGFNLLGQVGKKVEDVEEVKIENDSLTDDAKFEQEEILPEVVEEEPEEDRVEPEVEEAEVSEEEVETPEEDVEDNLYTQLEDDTEDVETGKLGDVVNLDEVEKDDTVEDVEEEEEVEEEPKEEKREKKESLKEAEGDQKESIQILFDHMLEPERVKKIIVYGEAEGDREKIYTGNFAELPEELLDREFVGFDVGDGMLIINVDSEKEELAEGQKRVKDVLAWFTDDFSNNISIYDQAEDDELYMGTKESALEEFAELPVVYIECPVTLQIKVKSENLKEEFCVVKEDELDYADPREKLICDIFMENGLSEFKADDEKTNEYWIKDAIDRNEDLDVIYNVYVCGKSPELVNEFKEVTGYKDRIEQAKEAEQENCEIEADYDTVRAEAEKELKNCDGFGIMFGYQKHGKFYALEPFIVIKDGREYQDKAEIIRLKYNPTGCIKVVFKEPIVESVKFNSRKELKEAVELCQKNNQPYTIRSLQNSKYELLKESPSLGFFGGEEIYEPEEESEVVEVEAQGTELIDPRDQELVDKLMRISHDIAQAIEEAYGVEADERFILADMIQDLQLVSGQLRPEDLVQTPLNELTREMYDAYNGFYEAMDEFTSFITGQSITTTQEEKLQQAIASLDSENFDREHIRERVQDPQFLLALQRQQVPGIQYNGNPRDVVLLTAQEEIEESVKESEGSQLDESLSEDEEIEFVDKIIKVLDEYGIIYGDIVDNEDRVNIVGVDEEEWEEVVEAIKAELGLEVIVPPQDHEEFDDELIVMKEEIVLEEEKEVESEEEVEFDEVKFENFMNEWFDENVEETTLFECQSGGIDEDGRIILEGILHVADNKDMPVKYQLKKIDLTETKQNNNILVFENYKVNIID